MEGHAEFLARHFVGDVWSSYGVDPGESTYSGFGTFNAGNRLQVTITCTFIIKAVQKSQVLRRIQSFNLLSKGQVMPGGLDT